MQTLTPFWEHLFDITAPIDVMDGVQLGRVSTGAMGDYIFYCPCKKKKRKEKKRRQMPFEMFICIWKKKLRALDSLQNGCLITFRAQLHLYFCLCLGLPCVSLYHVYLTKTPAEPLVCSNAKSHYCWKHHANWIFGKRGKDKWSLLTESYRRMYERWHADYGLCAFGTQTLWSSTRQQS